MVIKSPTVDERVHLTRGYVYLELGDLRFKICHPVLANALNAFPLWALTDLPLSTDDPAWVENRGVLFADHFIWQPGNDVDLIFFLSRLMTVAQGMLFAALVFRWARQLWGRWPFPAPALQAGARPPGEGCWGGVVALALFVFDPTIVAHSRLVTTDVAVSFLFFAATYALWRYLESPNYRGLVGAGVLFGLSQAAKFSALLLAPIFLLLIGLWPFLDRSHPRPTWSRWLWRTGCQTMALFAIGGLTLWAIYHFEFHPLSGGRWPLPAPTHWEEMRSLYFVRERYAFLAGRISSTGWWYYFPIAFLIKTPLPALLLIGRALLVRGAPGPDRRRIGALLLPVVVYLLPILFSPMQIGYRHFIPILPYLYVLTGRGIGQQGRNRILKRASEKPGFWVRSGWPWAMVVWSALIAWWIHPHYLAYFNALTSGPDNGWRYLVDSNLDWGQDLPTLRDVVERRNLGRIKLSYFGTAHPSYYGLDFEPLPMWSETPEQGNPFTHTYYPHDPAPGVYAISATHLQGVVMDPDKWDTYAWFRDRPPFAKAGYSIFLYQVEPTGPPVDVALSGLQVDEFTPETFAAFGSNDVRLRWFDAHTSLVIPSHPGWYAVLGADDTSGLGAWGWDITCPCTTTAGQTGRLYPPDPAAHAAAMTRIEHLTAASHAWRSPALVPSSDEQTSPLALPINLGDQLQFLGYELPNSPTPQLPNCQLLTVWRVTAPPDGSRAIFVHLLTPAGRVAAQWDGLHVAVEGWREGDTILQVASFDLPADLPPGQYWLQTGVYNPTTMERLPVLVGGTTVTDRILLSSVEVTGW